MEFWGVEVLAGKTIRVNPGEDTLVHISHASLGDNKGKKGEAVTLNVKVGEKKFVLGTLVTESIPQTCFDVLFDEEFELSHNWSKGSVHFVGFKCPNNKDEGGEDFSDSEEEEEVEVPSNAAGTAVAKPKPVTAQEDESDSDSEGDEDEDEDEDDDEDEEEEETPKAETRMKRAHEPAPKTPVSAKKAKVEATPKKTEEKKKGGKTPATATQSPKSASQVACGSCKKTFNSANALESHTKAKHSATAK